MSKTNPFRQLIWLSAIILLHACNLSGSGDSSPVVAEFKSNELTLNQLRNYIPDGSSSEDSVRFANYYIEEWIKQQAIAHEAMKTMTDLEGMIDFKVLDYRAKLTQAEYQNYLIRTKLDTNFARSEIVAYYEGEKENFPAQEELFSYFYVVISGSETQFIRELISSDKPSDRDTLLAWCKENAIAYKLDSTYVNEQKITEDRKGYNGDLKKGNPGQLIRWTGVIQGQRRRYFFKMLNKIDAGDPLPLSIVEDKIRNILLTLRKNELIETEEERILREARAKELIKRNL